MNEQEIKDKAHYIAVTGIISRKRNDRNEYLICRRGASEKLFPGKWCVPGGKVQQQDFINTKKDTTDHWFDILEKTLKKEILEETSIEIENIGYVSSLALVRPNGFTTVIISMHATLQSGEVVLDGVELDDFAWVTIDGAKKHDLIDNILEQLQKVDELEKKNKSYL